MRHKTTAWWTVQGQMSKSKLTNIQVIKPKMQQKHKNVIKQKVKHKKQNIEIPKYPIIQKYQNLLMFPLPKLSNISKQND